MAVVVAVEGLASLRVCQGQLEAALRLFSWTDSMRERIGDTRPAVEMESVERDLAVIRSKIDAIELNRLSTAGRSLTEEQAMALALAEVPE